MSSSTRKADAEGDLRRYPIPRLLYYLYKKQFLGELALTQPGGPSGTVYFRTGLPVYTDLRFESELLGRVLLERGLIREEQLQAAVGQLRPDGPRLGQILLQMGALTREQLVEGLRLQLGRKLVRVFAWGDATFALFSGEHSVAVEGEAAAVRVDPLQVISVGIRQAFDAERMQPELEKLRGVSVALPAAFDRVGARYGFGEEAGPLLSLLRQGAVSLEQLYGASTLGMLPTQMLVYTLWITEALAVPSLAGQQSRPSEAAAAPAVASAVASSPGQRQESRSGPGAAPRSVGRESIPGIRALAETFTGAAPEAPAKAAAREPSSTRIPAPDQPSSARIPAREPSSTRIPAPKPPSSARIPAREPSSTRIPAPDQPSSARIPAREPSSTRIPAHEPSSARIPVPLESGQPIGGSRTITPPADTAAVLAYHQRIKKTYKRLSEENYYQLLEVAPTATVEQIREAYFRLAKEFHPDRLVSLGMQDLGKEAAEIFRAINEAHTTLVDRQKRATYDEELKQGSKKQEAHDAVAAELAFQKGVAQLRRKDYAAATQQFGEAYRLNPKEGEHLGYLAWSQFSNPKANREAILPKIKEQLVTATQISPKSAACHYFLGEVYVALGDERRATNCFEKVLEIQPQHVEAARYLRIFQMRKDKQKDQQPKKGFLDRLRKK